MAKVNRLTCFSCNKEQSESREFYLSKSRLYEGIIQERRGRMLICKSCLFELYSDLFARYDDELKALYHLCMMLDICYDENLAESSRLQHNTIRDKYSIVKNYMKNINSSIGKNDGVGSSSLDSDHIALDDNIIKELEDKYRDEIDSLKEDKECEVKDIKIDGATRVMWGAGYTDEDYLFLETTYKEFTDVYESRTPAQRLIFKNIAKSLLEGDKALRNNNPKIFENMNNVVSKLMADGNIKPIQEASVAEDDTATWGKWINLIEQERPIGEPLEQFKDVDKISSYITQWFTKQMQRVFDLSSGDSNDN